MDRNKRNEAPNEEAKKTQPKPTQASSSETPLNKLTDREADTQSEQHKNSTTSPAQEPTNQNTSSKNDNFFDAIQHGALAASTSAAAGIDIANASDSQGIGKSEMKAATTSISGDQNPGNEQPLVGDGGLENQSIQSTDKKYDNPTSFQAEAGGMTATFTTQENAGKFREIFKDSSFDVEETLKNFTSTGRNDISYAINIHNTLLRAKGVICGNTGALKDSTNSGLNLKYEDVQAPDEAKLKAAEFLQEVKDWGNLMQTSSELENQLITEFRGAINRSGILHKSFFRKLWEKILHFIKWESSKETTKKDIEKLKQEIKSTLKDDFHLDKNTFSKLVDSEFKKFEQKNPTTIDRQDINDVSGPIITQAYQNERIRRVLELYNKSEYNIVCSGNILSTYGVNDSTTPFTTLNSNLGHIINTLIFGEGSSFSEEKALTAWSNIEKIFGLNSVNKAAQLMLLTTNDEAKRQQIRQSYQNYYETYHQNESIPKLYVWGSDVDKWWSEYGEIKAKEGNPNKNESKFSDEDQQKIKDLNAEFEKFKKERTTPLKEDGANENGPYRVLDLGNFRVMATEEQIQNLTLDQFNQIF